MKLNQTLLCFALFLLLLFQSAIGKPSNNLKFIISSCNTTRYSHLCIKCLSGLADKINRNENRLAQTALAVTLVRVKSTTVYVSKLTKTRNIKRREYLAVQDCVENFGDGVAMLSQSMKEMTGMGRRVPPLMGYVGRDRRDRDEFLWRLSNVETWVSAALTDETTCLDGFDGKVMDGLVKSMIRRRVVHVARITSNALALLNRFAARHN